MSEWAGDWVLAVLNYYDEFDYTAIEEAQVIDRFVLDFNPTEQAQAFKTLMSEAVRMSTELAELKWMREGLEK